MVIFHSYVKLPEGTQFSDKFMFSIHQAMPVKQPSNQPMTGINTMKNPVVFQAFLAFPVGIFFIIGGIFSEKPGDLG